MKQASVLFSSYLDRLKRKRYSNSSENESASAGLLINNVEDEEEEEDTIHSKRRSRCFKEMSLVSFTAVCSNNNRNSDLSALKQGPMRSTTTGVAAGANGLLAPRPRSGHRMCADDNFLYIFGGYNPAFKTFSELWRFNTTTERWCLMPDVEGLAPTASASSSMVMVGKNLFVFGGTGYPFAVSNSDLLFMYSLKKKRWFDLSSTLSLEVDEGDSDSQPNSFITSRRQIHFAKYPKDYVKQKSCGCRRYYDSQPSPKYGHGMAVVQDKIYIHSGTQGDVFLNEMHSFSLKSFRWSGYHFCGFHSRYEPKPRYRHELVAVGNRLCVVGGALVESTFPLDRMETFHVDTHSWHLDDHNNSRSNQGEEQTIVPVGRKAHSCVAFHDKLYVCGGYNSEEGLLDDFWSFDSKNGKWEQHKEVGLFFIFLFFVQFFQNLILRTVLSRSSFLSRNDFVFTFVYRALRDSFGLKLIKNIYHQEYRKG